MMKLNQFREVNTFFILMMLFPRGINILFLNFSFRLSIFIENIDILISLYLLFLEIYFVNLNIKCFVLLHRYWIKLFLEKVKSTIRLWIFLILGIKCLLTFRFSCTHCLLLSSQFSSRMNALLTTWGNILVIFYECGMGVDKWTQWGF